MRESSLSFVTVKVAHYGDILTDFTSGRNVVLLLPQLSLVDGYSYMILQVVPSKKDKLREFLDVSKSYADVKYVDVLSLPGLPQFFIVIKKNYGVMRALHRVGGAKVGPVTVVRGFKYFPVFIPHGSRARLIKYVKEFSPCDVDVRLLKSGTGTRPLTEVPSLTEYELYVLRVAYEEGYFEWPRKARLEDLAIKLGVSKATVAEHLRKALKKLLNTYITASTFTGLR
mgnify:CR=1 FL=1